MLRKTLNLEIMKNSSGRVQVAKKVRVGSGSGYSSRPGVYVFVFASVFVFVIVFQMSLDDVDLLDSLQLASEALLGITQIDHPLSLFGQPTPTTLI